MPRSLSLKREGTELSLTGGQAGRRLKNDVSEWQFDALNASLVTPTVAVQMVNNECDDHSMNSYMDNDTVKHPERCNGNRIIHFPRLLCAIQDNATCRLCAEQMLDEPFESFLSFCEDIVTLTDKMQLLSQQQKRLG
jgi:hypothetical protein